MASPRTARRANDIESGYRRSHRNRNRRRLFLLSCVIGFTLLILMGVAAVALLFLNDSTLPLFYFQSFHVTFGDKVDQFAAPVMVNISNPNKFRFRLVDGQYTIWHASRPVGGGVFSPVCLPARRVSTAATPAYLYSISNPVRDELVEGRGGGAVFDVEMQVKARVGVWLIETEIKDFHVNCRVSVDNLGEDANVSSSQCRSYYRKS